MATSLMARSNHPKVIGRPTKIDQILRYQDRGGERIPVTVADNIIELVRGGNYIETASLASGVTKDTVYRWIKEGALLNLALHNQGTTSHRELDSFTEQELRLSSFSDALMRAQAEAEAQDVLTSARLARGGITVTTVTEKTEIDPTTGAQTIVGRTVRTETTLPDGRMVSWRLAKRNPDTWGADRVEVTGAEGGAIELTVAARRDQLLDALDVQAARLAQEQEELADEPLALEPGDAP